MTPTWTNSDHAGSASKTGPDVGRLGRNAIGESKYWDSTAIFIFWDDYGGWYDPEPPAYVDYDGLGMRIPMLIVSPYAKKGHVSHVHYEHGSILRFVEDVFGLGRLAASDKRANSPAKDAFDFANRRARSPRFPAGMAGIISCTSYPTAICPTRNKSGPRSLRCDRPLACNGAGSFAPAYDRPSLSCGRQPVTREDSHIVILIQENR